MREQVFSHSNSCTAPAWIHMEYGYKTRLPSVWFYNVLDCVVFQRVLRGSCYVSIFEMDTSWNHSYGIGHAQAYTHRRIDPPEYDAASNWGYIEGVPVTALSHWFVLEQRVWSGRTDGVWFVVKVLAAWMLQTTRRRHPTLTSLKTWGSNATARHSREKVFVEFAQHAMAVCETCIYAIVMLSASLCMPHLFLQP